MNRADVRALAATTLAALDLFQQVYRAPRRTLDGESPVALILSQTLGIDEEARGLYTVAQGISLTIYVRCDPGSEAAAEDQLDAIVAAAVLALRAAGLTLTGSDSSPDGAPLRDIDKTYYRVERLTFRLDRDEED